MSSKGKLFGQYAIIKNFLGLLKSELLYRQKLVFNEQYASTVTAKHHTKRRFWFVAKSVFLYDAVCTKEQRSRFTFDLFLDDGDMRGSL